MDSKIVDNNEIKRIFDELSDLIITARKNVEKVINHELTFLYWNVGRFIKENVLSGGKAQYGNSIIEKLADMLIENYGKGFSQRNLFRMVKFYDYFQDEEILPTVLAKLSWSHIIEILSLGDALKREFYLTMAINEGWSVRELNGRISSMLYERTIISKKPELTIYNDLKELREKNKMSSDLFFRDPYVLDFLNLSDTYSEKDLENAIISELGRFILEMGNDFAFLARQKRITVDNIDYYMDLLFYHRKMKRLVVVELKLESFKPEHKGQVELYRVSTLGQVDQNDIPMQRIDCRKFAEQKGWTIIKEFTEKGISGFKVAAEDRDAIQEIKTDAIQGKFDVLLVFMFDRLGRRDDETPFVVEWFVRNGIEVWSTKEGEQRFDSHVDKLTNYIRYWQASGESIKTSMRTKARLKQIVEEGHYKGGTSPYGYNLVRRGRINKKNHELYELEVNEFEAAIVEVIYHKNVNEGLGIQRIATYLNESGIKTRSGLNWHPSSIRGILRNPTYVGILRSGESRSQILSHLVIVEKEIFDRAQEIAEQRSKVHADNRTVPLNTRGQSLLAGNAYCGHCGSKLTLTTNGSGYVRKNGELTMKKRIRYVCYNKTRKRCNCDGQTGYTMTILDDIVEVIIHQLFDRLKSIPENEIVGQKYQETVKAAQVKLNKAKTDFAKVTKEISDYKAEVVKVIRGESNFSADLLNSLIADAQGKSNETERIIDTLQNELEDSKRMLAEIKTHYNKALSWSEIFDRADIETKKMIVSYLINKVWVRRGYNVEIEFNIDYEQFSEGMDKKLSNLA